MNRIVLSLSSLAVILCLISSCKKKKDPEPEPENQAPTVSLLKPEEGISYDIVGSDTTFAIEANATDPDGLISKVEFYIDGTKIGEDNISPYSYDYTFAPNIGYTIKVIATDNEGKSTTKQFVQVVVIPK
jgi:hypothetical protein